MVTHATPLFRRTAWRAGILGMLLVGGAPSHGHERPPAPNLALSAAFAPVRYVAQDSAQRERLLEFLQSATARMENEAAPFSVQGKTFTLSRRWVSFLAAEGAPSLLKPGAAPEDEPTRRRRAHQRLEKAVGPLEEAGMGFPAGYLPVEASYVHQASAAEESKAHCRQKPMWPYLGTSAFCGRTITGADIGMAQVWDRFDGADTLVIAVLDAGFDFLHPELQGRWAVNEAEANGLPGVDDDGNGFVDDIRGWDFVDDDNDPQDYNGHGTMTTGVIAAGFDNGIGIPGMLPRVRILPVRALSTAGFGSTAGIAAGIRYAVARGAHVINFSIGISAPGTNATLREAFAAARNAGTIVVAASGNDGLNLDVTPRQPFSYGFENIYGVAAYDPAPNLTGFSNHGANTVDIAAPGDHIVTTGIPPALTLLKEDFENFTGAGWNVTNSWVVAPDENGGKSLQWTAANTATVSRDGIDLRGKRGGLLTFRLTFQPASVNDGLDVYVLTGSDTIPVSGISRAVDNEVISINLGMVDDASFRLVFRACVLNRAGNCSSTASPAGRTLRLDDISITHADLDPAKHTVITVTGGTSLAAPFFAGYAGLMRLAADRTGVPLTRPLMLSGARPEPWLAGKVITGGRLDVAKGLDFYLKTLPRIVVTDPEETSWQPGAAVTYALTVHDEDHGPRHDFTFSPIALPPGSALSPEGLFAWATGAAPQGAYAVRARADNGMHTLRSLTTFTVGTPLPVRTARPDQASRLRVGGHLFLLPSAVMTAHAAPRMLRLELYGADGKTLRTLEGPFTLPPGARMVDYRIGERDGLRGVGARAWLDGVALRPVRD